MRQSKNTATTTPGSKPPDADRGVIESFLARARPWGPLLLVRISPDTGKARGATFDMPDRLEQAAAWAERHTSSGFGVYWTPNIALLGLDKKAAKEDMLETAFCWVDIDPAIGSGGYAAARKALLGKGLKALQASKPRPSIIVDSGNGLQAFWQFMPTEGGLLPAGAVGEAVNKALLQCLGGDPSAYNLDRVMRLPGTINWPSEAKIRKGYPRTPTLARVVEVRDDCYLMPGFAALVLGKGKVPENVSLADAGEVGGSKRARKGSGGPKEPLAPPGPSQEASWAANRSMACWCVSVLLAAQKHGTPSMYRDDHAAWIAMGQALHHCSKGHAAALDLWLDASPSFPRYVAGHAESEMRDSWMGFKRELGPNTEPVTIGTLIKWARITYVGLPAKVARALPEPGTAAYMLTAGAPK